MSVSDELQERAARHGLERREDGAWTSMRGPVFVHFVGHEEEGWWSGDPSHGWYSSEAAALSAALDRLDHECPERAWRASPGVKLGEARRTLNRLAHYLPTELIAEVTRVVGLLNEAALPPASDEGEVLVVALEYLLHLGVLPASARPAFVETLRQHPEVLEGLPIAGPWRYDAVCSDWRRHALDGRVVCRAWRSTRRDDPPTAWASAYLEESGTVWVSQAAAMDGVDSHARYPGRWVLVGGVPEAAVEAETAPVQWPTTQACWNCGLTVPRAERCESCGSYLPATEGAP